MSYTCQQSDSLDPNYFLDQVSFQAYRQNEEGVENLDEELELDLDGENGEFQDDLELPLLASSNGLTEAIFSSKKIYFRSLVKDSYHTIYPYLKYLSPIDTFIVRIYCIDELSQEQISILLGISQAAVSNRFKLVFERIKFLFKMPSLSPLKVRNDFQELFPQTLFEFAYFFYWICSQNRVKYYIQTSQSGAANKFNQVLDYLEANALTPDSEIVDAVIERRQYLSLLYVDYFRQISKKANLINSLYKKNDNERTGSLIKGDSILA